MSGIGAEGSGAVRIEAPAKLTLSLRVTGVRPDGYHLLDAEFVTVDLFDTMYMAGGAEHAELTVSYDVGGEHPDWPWPLVPVGRDNLAVRALEAVDRTVAVRLVKRIPPGAGLGGGSADAAAVLRWAGRTDPALAASLGADVPFCVGGGRARVRGIGELVDPLPYEERTFTLLVPPFGMDTAAVYKAWDEFAAERGARTERGARNGLEVAAVALEPRLLEWKGALATASGRQPQLAGSGSTWFVEGSLAAATDDDRAGRRWLELGAERGLLVEVTTTPRHDDAGGRA